uniref:Uncharacterized protein n=1 Tax=Anguilla anguilla TaxID=7936 RepID=A0A0E9TYJ2_ANGAN
MVLFILYSSFFIWNHKNCVTMEKPRVLQKCILSCDFVLLVFLCKIFNSSSAVHVGVLMHSFRRKLKNEPYSCMIRGISFHTDARFELFLDFLKA